MNIGRSGTAAAPIVFESAPGECAILDGTGTGGYERVIIDGASHVVFRNFVVRNSRYEGVYIARGDDNVVSHVRSHGNTYSGFGVLDGDRNVFRYVIAHDNFDAPYGGNADGIAISRGDGNRVEHCMSYRNSDDGVDTWLSTNSVVEYCVSFDNGWQGGDGNGFKAGGQGVTTNTVVRHSVSFGNRANGFDWNTSPGFTFDQNTAYGNGSNGFVGNGGTMRNNLSFANGGTVSGSSAQTTNSWNLGLSSGGFVSTVRGNDGYLALTAGIRRGRRRHADRPTLHGRAPRPGCAAARRDARLVPRRAARHRRLTSAPPPDRPCRAASKEAARRRVASRTTPRRGVRQTFVSEVRARFSDAMKHVPQLGRLEHVERVAQPVEARSCRRSPASSA